MHELSSSEFQVVHRHDFLVDEDMLVLKILLYDINIVEDNTLAELARRSVQKHEKTVGLLKYNSHGCYINGVFQRFRFPNCDNCFNRASKLEQNLTTYSKRVEDVYPRNVYQIRETLFDKLDSFGFKYTSELKLFKDSALVDFESICLQEETFKDTNTAIWGKKVLTSVSLPPNRVEGPILFCNSDSHHIVAYFIGALQNVASQYKAKLKYLFTDIDTATKVRRGEILEKLTQHHIPREQVRRKNMSHDNCENDNCAATNFLQIQKN